MDNNERILGLSKAKPDPGFRYLFQRLTAEELLTREDFTFRYSICKLFSLHGLAAYLPMQKVEKIRLRMSSAVVPPVRLSNCRSDEYKSSRTIS